MNFASNNSKYHDDKAYTQSEGKELPQKFYTMVPNRDNFDSTGGITLG